MEAYPPRIPEAAGRSRDLMTLPVWKRPTNDYGTASPTRSNGHASNFRLQQLNKDVIERLTLALACFMPGATSTNDVHHTMLKRCVDSLQ
jgi:hypothetical protein